MNCERCGDELGLSTGAQLCIPCVNHPQVSICQCCGGWGETASGALPDGWTDTQGAVCIECAGNAPPELSTNDRSWHTKAWAGKVAGRKKKVVKQEPAAIPHDPRCTCATCAAAGVAEQELADFPITVEGDPDYEFIKAEVVKNLKRERTITAELNIADPCGRCGRQIQNGERYTKENGVPTHRHCPAKTLAQALQEALRITQGAA
jgi:hypothetical protein